MIFLNAGSCVEKGFQGCCTFNCQVYSPTGICYCDEICHSVGDCCSDILDIDCYGKLLL